MTGARTASLHEGTPLIGEAHVEITGAIVRLFDPGKSYAAGDQHAFGVKIVGDDGRAILKDAHGRFSRDRWTQLNDVLKRLGFTQGAWDRRGPHRREFTVR